METRLAPGRLAALCLAYVGALHLCWIAAWLLEQWLEVHTSVLATSGERFAYWQAMKILLWLLPSVVLIRLSGRTIREVFAFDRVRAILLWGAGVGLLLGLTAWITKTTQGQPFLHLTLGWPLLGGIVLAPIIEEFTFRGAILGALEPKAGFHYANILTALFFAGIHFPGWYFQGRLLTNLVNPVGGAISIFLLGLLFGYVVHKSKSVAAGCVTHILNNLFSA
jgi:membrane protease YdiL (CAAX protease family)